MSKESCTYDRGSASAYSTVHVQNYIHTRCHSSSTPAVADPGLVTGGGAMGVVREGGGCTLPDCARGFGKPPKIFSLDMLLETHLGVNHYAKFTQIEDNAGWTMVQKCGEQYS